MGIEEIIREDLVNFTRAAVEKEKELREKVELSNRLQKEIPALAKFLNDLRSRINQLNRLLDKNAKKQNT